MYICRAKSCRIGSYVLTIATAFLVFAGAAFAEDQLQVVVNPYANVDWKACQQHKANLHTHTTQSDGRMAPEVVMQKYRERGYDILALTDHNRCIWPWSKYDSKGPQGMLPIMGNELSRHHHAQSLFCTLETGSKSLEQSLKEVGEAGGLSIINHPAMHWPHGRSMESAPAIQVKLTPALRNLTQDDFTVEAWFRTTSPGRNILMGNYAGGKTGHLNLELHADNQVRVFVSGKKVTDLNVSANDLGINTRDGKWHHLAGTRQGKVVMIYLDGQLAGAKRDIAEAYDLQGDTYFIGRDTRSGATAFEGDLDNVRLWSRALSPKEMASLFDGKSPGEKGGPATDGLLAQYTFESNTSKPMQAGVAVSGAVADSGKHAKGPFHAKPTTQITPTVVTDPATALRQAGHSRTAFRFTQKSNEAAKNTKENLTPEELIPETIAERYLKLMEDNPHLIGMEVLNGTRPLSEYPYDRGLWDALLIRLMPSRPVWGFANDDMHGIQHLGRDWTSVLCRKLDEKSVREAYSNGTFFFSSTRVHQGQNGSVEATPSIKRVDHDQAAGTITIAATESGKPLASDAYRWIADGKLIHVGPTLNYRTMPNIGSYVRAELLGQGGITLTNPFGFSRK